MRSSLGRRSLLRPLLATVGLLLGLSAFASAAQACSYPDAEQVFSRWEDNGYYELAPDGGLEEGGNGWTLRGGAQLVTGNESAYLNGAADDTALSIPFGGWATSPTVCVDGNTPAFRLMALNGGDPSSKLRVIVTYETRRGMRVRGTDVRAGGSWAPTDPIDLEIDGET
ncbi:MAG TPA: hypothetical protein VG518_08505, partial [Solirubrobacterales bacterium]|nr:hypothetical protein [Solirubrobacterales bacterium]